MQVKEKTKKLTATQWNKDGDHLSVEPYKLPHINPNEKCPCGRMWKKHGLLHINTQEGYTPVCPGAWIVAKDGEHRTYSEVDFTGKFEEVV